MNYNNDMSYNSEMNFSNEMSYNNETFANFMDKSEDQNFFDSTQIKKENNFGEYDNLMAQYDDNTMKTAEYDDNEIMNSDNSNDVAPIIPPMLPPSELLPSLPPPT